MVDQLSTEPASTREVVGEVLLHLLRVLVELQSTRVADAGLRVAILAAVGGDHEETVKILNRLWDEDDDRVQKLNQLIDDVQTLIWRFAGEPHA